MDSQFSDQKQETLNLLKILALVKKQIEQGKFKDAASLFEQTDREFKQNSWAIENAGFIVEYNKRVEAEGTLLQDFETSKLVRTK